MRRALATFLILSAMAWLPAVAQEAQDVFTDTLDVQAVDVEVVVTDRKGNPVTGLTAADFQLLVDGKPVPVEYFAEIRDGGAVAPPATATGTVAVPNPQSLQPGEVVGNSYLVFVDEYFTPPAMRNEALKGLAREVDSMRPQDRMAIVAFTGRKLVVLVPWTAPGEPLRKFLEQLGEHKASLAATPFSFADLEPSANQLLENYSSAVDSEASNGSGTATGGWVEMVREAYTVENAIENAANSLRGFAAVSGRKIMILLSGGWNFRSPVRTHKSRTTEAPKDGTQRLRPLLDTANLLGFTIYPIHLAQEGPVSLPRAGTVAAGAVGGASSGLTGSVGQQSLVIAAQETGGKFLLPGRNRHISRIAEDTRSYYWLGFSHSGGQQARRDIEVRAARKGLEVRSRKSYVPLSRQARLSMDLERALLTGDSSDMGALSVSVGQLQKVERDIGELSVTVRIPATELNLVQQDGRYVGRLELRIAALDDQGQRSDVPVLHIQIAREDAPQSGAVIRYDTKLRIRYGPQNVQFVLFDTLSGKSFAERVRVQP